MRMPTKKSTAAFSLIEMLAALSLVMLMFGALYSSWSAILSSTRSGTEAATNVQRERVAVQHLADALAGAVMVEDGENWYRFRAATQTGYTRLSFVQRIPENDRKPGAQSFRRVSFSVEPSANAREWQLVRREIPVTQARRATPPEPKVIARRIRHFLVEFLNPAGEWVSHWAGTGRLPRQARIALAIGPGGPKDLRVREIALLSSAITHGNMPAKATLSAKEFEEDGFPVDGYKRHVFVIDKSGSMRRNDLDPRRSRMDVAKEALFKTLSGMTEEQEFYIVFFNNEPEAMPLSVMLPATPDNVNSLRAWINSQDPQGGTNPSPALTQAFEQEPDVVWLLSDGEFSRRVNQLVTDMNPGRTVRINTLGFGTRWYYGSQSLRRLATENGGSFTLVTPTTP
jgi:type II secretory pathway pseudopilin PulG